MKFILKYKSYVLTFGVEFIILILSFLVYRIASEQMTNYGFSEYTLSRRSISFLQPLFMIGLGVAVPRYASIYAKRNSFFITGIALIAFASLLFLSIFLINQEYFAILFFGDVSYTPYILPLLLLLTGSCFHAIIYGFLRGKQNIYFSNLTQLLNIGILPIVVVIFSHNVLELLYINSCLLFFNCLVFSLIIVKKNPLNLTLKKFVHDSKILLTYGLPRILGDFALLALLTSPTYLVLYFQDDILLSGDVAYAITLLNLTAAGFGPLGLVLLPEIATFMREKQHHLIEKRFFVFLIFSVAITIIGYFIYYLFSDFILSLLLGDSYRESVQEISLTILLGSFGYSLYIVLRTFLDAIRVRATNAFNLIIVLLLYIALVTICYYQNGDLKHYLYAFVISVNILGVLTLIQTYRAIKRL